MNLSDYTPKPTSHFTKTVKSKGFDPRVVIDTLKNPEEVYRSGSHPGQYRVTGNGLCIVGRPNIKTMEFVLITIYLDRVITPPRPDQMNTTEGRRYAERYAAGLGRG